MTGIIMLFLPTILVIASAPFVFGGFIAGYVYTPAVFIAGFVTGFNFAILAVEWLNGPPLKAK